MATDRQVKREQDTQCTYIVTIRRVLATIIAVESSKYCIISVCICSFSYKTCNAHAPYCHLRPAELYNIFPHYLINITIFENKVLNIKCVF
jgi:hypothetical protein